tara:strand:+ start:3803 stop:4129 length:327 start_codon:yes stop_codon:yes gene_type:complete
MFAVVKHTCKLDIPEPENVFSAKSSMKWMHLVWIFEDELQALTYAISLLDDPLLKANDYMFESAINQLQENRFYQLGSESVAIAEVQEAPELIYEEIKKEIEDEESIH